MSKSGSIVTIATAALSLTACAPALRLEPVPVLTSEEWSGAAEPGTASGQPLAVLLGSPELAALTDRALARNAEIHIAQTRIAQASALLRGARQAQLPAVTASAGLNRDQGSAISSRDFESSFARLDFELDLDLFGKLRAQRSAAVARTRAAELERDAVALAVESNVASAYVQQAALAAQLRIIAGSIARAEELARVIGVRANEGVATRVDVGLQSIQLLNLREQRSRLEQAMAQTRTALALLAGEEAPQFDVEPARLEDFALPALATPAPADVLAARPDVLAAEALIVAASGDARAARASFFPSVGVNLAGLVASAPSGPLGQTVMLGSSLLAPIFSRGRLASDLDFASAMQAETVERYRLSVLTALTQVEDARSAIFSSGERALLIDNIVAEAATTARLANMQYIEGEQDLLSVLDAQQSLNEAEAAHVLATQEQLLARIALYQATGGKSRTGPAIVPMQPRLD